MPLFLTEAPIARRRIAIPDSCVYVLGMVTFENMTPDFGFGNFNNGEGYCLSFDPYMSGENRSHRRFIQIQVEPATEIHG
jgi:hypothetical protein